MFSDHTSEPIAPQEKKSLALSGRQICTDSSLNTLIHCCQATRNRIHTGSIFWSDIYTSFLLADVNEFFSTQLMNSLDCRFSGVVLLSDQMSSAVPNGGQIRCENEYDVL
jgi:hypothetical protein